MSSLVVEPGNTDRGWVTNFDSFANGTNGLKMVDGAADSATAFSRGDWIEGSINGVSAAIDVVGMILNPLGSVCSMVINWILEHCGPLQDWLDELLGDPGVIKASSQTWSNIGDHLGSLGPEYSQLASADAAGYSGLAIDAYRLAADALAGVIEGLSKVSYGVSAGITVAGGLLAGVRDFIQGLFSDIVGDAAGAIAQSALTLGIAAPSALGGLIAKAKSVVQRCQAFMKALATSLDKMAKLLADISPALESSTKLLADICRNGANMPVSFAISLGKGVSGSDDT
ncbi:hypothetical protein [Nocardioides sp. InS609-2]|uniref:hypothetical protein n=1 Tax=Nocardioides sp. InS609-2 TaxID=2760705 RepID=UPI0020BE6CF3|nr:hypothetical protein [Nocardioides sp. InS609-2]